MFSSVKTLYDIDDKNFIGAFLYGSQNYGLDTPDSDNDIIILVKEDEKARRELRASSGITKIYTIKYFLHRLEKGDMECYEILFTKYRLLNKEYEAIFDKFVNDFAEVINIERIEWALGRKLAEHLMNIAWIPFNRDGSNYHKKRVYWSYRVFDQLSRIINGEALQTTFTYNVEGREELLKIKTITNHLSTSKLTCDTREMNKIFAVLPRTCAALSEQESECFSRFYNEISLITKEEKSDG